MARQVRIHQLNDLAHDETKNEILLDTEQNTELHIILIGNQTIIKFPFGNKFDVIDGKIVIHSKNK